MHACLPAAAAVQTRRLLVDRGIYQQQLEIGRASHHEKQRAQTAIFAGREACYIRVRVVITGFFVSGTLSPWH